MKLGLEVGMTTLERAYAIVERGGILLLKGPAGRTVLPKAGDETGRRAGRRRIRCPQCDWEPGRHDLWQCICLHRWNTFETRGVCPACGLEWPETQCRRCGRWSPHDDWYDEDGGPV